MSNNTTNKPKSANFKDINTFVDQKNSQDKASNESVGTPTVSAKAPEAAKTNVGTPSVEAKPKATKRKTAKEWDSILEEMDREGLAAADISAKYGVTESNVYQWRSKRKAKLEQEEVASLSSNSLVDDAKKLIAGIDKELADFDKGIEEAKAKVASAKDDRAKIEAKTKKYQTIIDMFTEEEAKK